VTSSDIACVLTSCLRVCQSDPRCNSSSCRTNVDVLVRRLPTDSCGADSDGESGSRPTVTSLHRRRRGRRQRRRRRRALRSVTVEDEVVRRRSTSKRGYSDTTDDCLNYNCGMTRDETIYDYIQCAIDNQCGMW